MIHNDIYIFFFIYLLLLLLLLFIIIIIIDMCVCVCVFGSYEHSYGIYDGQMSCYLLVWKGLH